MALDSGRWLREKTRAGARNLPLIAVVVGVCLVGIAAMAVRAGDEDVPTVSEADRAGVADIIEEAGDQAHASTATRPASIGDQHASPPGAEALDDDGAGPDGAADASEPAPEIDWVSASEPSPVTALPASERVPKPEAVRGIYVGSWPLADRDRLERLIRLADETEVNAFVIDVKDVTGEVTYATQVPLAGQVGATRNIRIRDIRGVLEKLREHGIYPIARIVAFKDPVLADARPEWAIEDRDGGVWEDNKGVRWVDSFNEDVWAYNIELAREAVALGFSEIQWDYVRFPDAPQSYMATAVYPARDGRTLSQGIRSFMVRSREELGDLGAPLTADVFGITTSAFHDVGIGQLWEDMADVMDVLLPMVYPSHYPPGSWGFELPNAAPYQIVRKAMRHGVERSKDIEGAATIRPWLQAFSMGEPRYGPEHIRAQIDAVYDAGLTEWILWDPAVRYSAEPLATAEGVEPWFAGRGAELYEPDADPDDGDRDGVLGAPVGGAPRN